MDNDSIIYHQVVRQSLLPMTESGGMSEDATGYYATPKVQPLSSASFSLLIAADSA